MKYKTFELSKGLTIKLRDGFEFVRIDSKISVELDNDDMISNVRKKLSRLLDIGLQNEVNAMIEKFGGRNLVKLVN